jgi:hypothetical protein
LTGRADRVQDSDGGSVSSSSSALTDADLETKGSVVPRKRGRGVSSVKIKEEEGAPVKASRAAKAKEKVCPHSSRVLLIAIDHPLSQG